MEEPVSRDPLHDQMMELRNLAERLMTRDGRWERARELLGRLRATEASQRRDQLRLLREQGESADVLSFLEMYLRLPPDAELASSPEFREWVLRQFTEEEVIAELRKLRELKQSGCLELSGWLELSDFLPELEQLLADQ